MVPVSVRADLRRRLPGPVCVQVPSWHPCSCSCASCMRARARESSEMPPLAWRWTMASFEMAPSFSWVPGRFEIRTKTQKERDNVSIKEERYRWGRGAGMDRTNGRWGWKEGGSQGLDGPDASVEIVVHASGGAGENGWKRQGREPWHCTANPCMHAPRIRRRVVRLACKMRRSSALGNPNSCRRDRRRSHPPATHRHYFDRLPFLSSCKPNACVSLCPAWHLHALHVDGWDPPPFPARSTPSVRISGSRPSPPPTTQFSLSSFFVVLLLLGFAREPVV